MPSLYRVATAVAFASLTLTACDPTALPSAAPTLDVVRDAPTSRIDLTPSARPTPTPTPTSTPSPPTSAAATRDPATRTPVSRTPVTKQPTRPSPSADPPPSQPARPTPTTAPPSTSRPAPSSPPGDRSAADEVLALVNDERAKAGCPAVRLDDRLSAAAVAHSADMAQNDYFSHDGRDGRSFVDRARAAGYSTPRSENIAAGQRSATEVTRGWMQSPGHRRNILDCGAVDMGLGTATGGGFGIYWTQVFGSG